MSENSFNAKLNNPLITLQGAIRIFVIGISIDVHRGHLPQSLSVRLRRRAASAYSITGECVRSSQLRRE